MRLCSSEHVYEWLVVGCICRYLSTFQYIYIYIYIYIYAFVF